MKTKTISQTGVEGKGHPLTLSPGHLVTNLIERVFGAEINRRVALAVRALDDARDVLVSGARTRERDRFDYDREEALHAVLAEWSSNRPFADRVANLTDGSGTPGRANAEFFLKKHETVFDDADLDLLFPLGGDDWLFAFGDLVLGAGFNDRVER